MDRTKAPVEVTDGIQNLQVQVLPCNRKMQPFQTQSSGCQRRHHQNYESLLLQVTPSSADGREGIRARQEELLSSLLAFEDPDLRKINVPQFTGDGH
ncbi:unnamed protein product [Caretta caretta]